MLHCSCTVLGSTIATAQNPCRIGLRHIAIHLGPVMGPNSPTRVHLCDIMEASLMLPQPAT
uniref:Uncharacterized protein n=1 Tax=Arundo donax TaxID=35708 RepID=A0A0A9G0F3_ARUDO